MAESAQHHLQSACRRLQSAAEDLESALGLLRSDGAQAELHEAIGAIMESLQLVASAHARTGA